MAFGIDSGISRSTQGTCEVAKKIGPSGAVLEMTTHGAMQKVDTEDYTDSPLVNEAVNGQTGTSVVSAHSLDESNTDYAKSKKTTEIAGAEPTT